MNLFNRLLPLFSTTAVLNNTINYVFIATCIAITIVFGTYYTQTKDSVFTFFEQQLIHLNKNHERALITAIHNNVATMEVLGQHLLTEIEYITDGKNMSILSPRYDESESDEESELDIKIRNYAAELVNEVDNNYDSIYGLGLVSTSGQAVAISGFNKEDYDAGVYKKWPNLRTDIMTDDEWANMYHGNVVIGRTYYAEAIHQWIIPIRILVAYNNNLIIVTSGIAIGTDDTVASSIYDKAEPALDNSITYFYRNDKYLQFATLSDRPLSEIYNAPFVNAKPKTREYNKLVQIKCSVTANHVYAVITYNEEFDMHTVVTLPGSSITKIYWDRYSFILIFYVLMIISAGFAWLFITSLVKSHHTILSKQANFDSLTQLPNRANLNKELTNRLQHAKNTNTIMGLFFIDLDDFKQINDTYNHIVGDKLLIEVAKRFKDILRSDDFVARLGGDEFVVITSDFGNNRRTSVDVKKIADQIHAATTEKIDLGDMHLYSNSSIGISIYPIHAKTESELLRTADMAMYQSKREGKNRYTIYTKDVESTAKRDFELRQELRKAIIDDNCEEFYILYQPQVKVKTKLMVGFEALVRWNNDKFPTVGPDEFIPIVEEMRLIDELGDFILNNSLKEWTEYRDQYCTQCNEHDHAAKIAINMSTLQFHRPNQVQYIKDILKQYNMEPGELEIEMTESALIDEFKEFDVIEELAEYGINVSIDDFGTGYSSLKKLNTMPFNCIKIDKSFIDQIGTDIKGESLIHTILLLGNKLGVNIVAEGVETIEQCDYLIQHDQDIIIQGYIFSQPVPMSAIKELCMQNGFAAVLAHEPIIDWTSPKDES